MRHTVRLSVRHAALAALLLASASAAAQAPQGRACMVAGLRWISDLNKGGAQLSCEGGRYSIGVADQGNFWKGVMLCTGEPCGQDKVEIWTLGKPVRPGQVYLCRDTKEFPRAWSCALDP